MSSNRPVRPTRLHAEDLSGMTTRDFYPNRRTQEDNTNERMLIIKTELAKLYELPRRTTPNKDDYPTLYHELPTLWAMIEEGKFQRWNPRDQAMLNEMIELRMKVLADNLTDEDAEKHMGISLADRYIYSKTGGKP